MGNTFTYVGNYCTPFNVQDLDIESNGPGNLTIEGGAAGVDFKSNGIGTIDVPNDPSDPSDVSGYLHVTASTICGEPCVPSPYYVYQSDPGRINDHSPIHNRDSDEENLPSYKMSSEFGRYNKDYVISYPNPFQTQAKIEFAVKNSGIISLNIVDEQGVEIASLIDGKQYVNGGYTIQYNGSSLAAGTYFCVLQTSTDRKTFKMIKTK